MIVQSVLHRQSFLLARRVRITRNDNCFTVRFAATAWLDIAGYNIKISFNIVASHVSYNSVNKVDESPPASSLLLFSKSKSNFLFDEQIPSDHMYNYYKL